MLPGAQPPPQPIWRTCDGRLDLLCGRGEPALRTLEPKGSLDLLGGSAGGWLVKKGEMIQVPFYAAFTADFPGAPRNSLCCQ